jgi:uncharacterized protein YgiM (DUF1202 family)
MTSNTAFWAGVLLSTTVATSLARGATTATVIRDRVNVRGQPTIFSEVITQLRQEETVTILEEIKLSKPKAGEPADWVKISLPLNTPVWVHAGFIDPAAKAVKVARLNLRGGPGENFSILGQITKDTVVKEIRVEEDWMEIEAPANAYAFVAMELLKKAEPEAKPEPSPARTAPAAEEPAPKAVQPAEPAPSPTTEAKPAEPAPTPPTEAKAAEATPPAPAAEQKPVQAEPEVAAKAAEKEVVLAQEARKAEAQPTPAVAPPAPVATEATAVPGQQLKRIVRREGVVKRTVSIQAPTEYELVNAENGKVMNYLHPTSPDQKIKPMRGRRVIVTGEELIDPRWPKTPVIDLETIELAP